MKLEIGSYSVDILDCGTFRLDGGAMFGVVPKTIWSRTNPADDLNRITLGLRPILISGRGRRILVDAGMGDKFSPKHREMYAIDNEGRGIVEALAAVGCRPEEVTDVILTHLHFDHCAGFTRYGAGGRSELVFPDADIYVQRSHREAATAPTERDRASFLPDDLGPLLASPRLRVIDGDAELFPGVSARVFNGHTRGMQSVIISDAGRSACYLSDLVPTATHVSVPFIMGYDLQPLVIIEEKKKMLSEMAEKGTLAIFEHDPEPFPALIEKTEKGFSAKRIRG